MSVRLRTKIAMTNINRSAAWLRVRVAAVETQALRRRDQTVSHAYRYYFFAMASCFDKLAPKELRWAGEHYCVSPYH